MGERRGIQPEEGLSHGKTRSGMGGRGDRREGIITAKYFGLLKYLSCLRL